MRVIILLLFLLTASAESASAKIVMDLSEHTINISRHFKGTTVTAFGVCDKNEDIIIVVKGGNSELKVKKMKKKHYIWMVDSVIDFSDVPNIYTLYSNKKIENILPYKDIEDLHLNITGLSIKENVRGKDDIFYLYESFRAMTDKRKQYNLLGEYPYSVEKVDNSTLFRIKLNIPDRIKTGTYDVIAYSVKDGKITSIVAIPLNIRKIGITGILYHLAFSYGKTYATLVVCWAMFIGWFTNYIIQAVLDKIKIGIKKDIAN